MLPVFHLREPQPVAIPAPPLHRRTAGGAHVECPALSDVGHASPELRHWPPVLLPPPCSMIPPELHSWRITLRPAGREIQIQLQASQPLPGPLCIHIPLHPAGWGWWSCTGRSHPTDPCLHAPPCTQLGGGWWVDSCRSTLLLTSSIPHPPPPGWVGDGGAAQAAHPPPMTPAFMHPPAPSWVGVGTCRSPPTADPSLPSRIPLHPAGWGSAHAAQPLPLTPSIPHPPAPG